MAPQVEAKPQPGIGFDCPESGIPEMDEDQRLKNEKEALGCYDARRWRDARVAEWDGFEIRCTFTGT